MALHINVIDGHGPRDKMCCQLQPKQTKAINAALSVYIIAKGVLPPFITNKIEHLSFKSGCVILVENGETPHQLQPKKAKVRLLHYSKRQFTCSSLLTRRRALVLRVDMPYAW